MADPVEPESDEIDPENLARAIELELIQKRAAWTKARERYRMLRAAGFLFLFLVIAGCMIGFFFAYVRISEQRANQPPKSAVAH